VAKKNAAPNGDTTSAGEREFLEAIWEALPKPEPISKDEAERWRHKDLWTLREAATLLCGCRPLPTISIWWYCETDEAADAVERAVAARYLHKYEFGGELAVKPADVIEWLNRPQNRERFPKFPFLRDGRAAQVRSQAEPAAPPRENSRRDALDPVIDKAIALAGGSYDAAAVWLQLKNLALDGDAPPFTGGVDGSALVYTNANNQIARLTRDALSKRLKRRLQINRR
jgi:hypothetical protein